MSFKSQRMNFLAVALSLTSLYGCTTALRDQSAQSAPAGPRPTISDKPADVTTEALHVRKALDTFFHAVDVRDWKTVDEVLSADFEFYGDDSMVLTRAEFINAMREDDMKIDKLELKDVKVSLSPDGQMAWVKYSAHLESSMRGAPYNMASVETVAFRKEDGNWKMTHNHASVKKLDAKPAKA